MIPHPFGYDFFISYSRAAGMEYPASIYDALTRVGYTVFLDKHGYIVGDDLPRETVRRIRGSSCIIFIVGLRTFESSWVLLEARHALAMRKRCMVICIGEATDDLWVLQPDGDAGAAIGVLRELRRRLRFAETPGHSSTCSDACVAEITRAWSFVRKRRLRTTYWISAAVVLCILSCVALLARKSAIESDATAGRERAARDRRQAYINAQATLATDPYVSVETLRPFADEQFDEKEAIALAIQAIAGDFCMSRNATSTSSVSALYVAGGDAYIVDGRDDGSIGLYTGMDVRERRTLLTHGPKVVAVLPGPGDAGFLSIGSDCSVRRWSVSADNSSAKMESESRMGDGELIACIIDATRHRIAGRIKCDGREYIRVVNNMTSAQCAYDFDVGINVSAMEFDLNELLYFATHQRLFAALETSTGQVVCERVLAERPVVGIGRRASTQRIILVNDSGEISMLAEQKSSECDTRKLDCDEVVHNHICKIAESGDVQVVAGTGGVIGVSRFTHSERLETLAFLAHREDDTVVGMAVSSDGALFATSGFLDGIRVFRTGPLFDLRGRSPWAVTPTPDEGDEELLAPERRMSTGTGYAITMAFAPSGRYLVSGGVGGDIRVWRTFGGLPFQVLDGIGRVREMAFARDTAKALVVSEGGWWLVSPLDDPSPRRCLTGDEEVPHARRLWAAPDGLSFFVDRSEDVVIVDGESGVLTRVPRNGTEKVVGAWFSTSRRTWMSVDQSGEVFECALDGGALRGTSVMNVGGRVEDCAWSTSGEFLAVLVNLREVRVFDMERRQESEKYQFHELGASRLVYSEPMGKFVVADMDGRLTRLDMNGQSGRLVEFFGGPMFLVTSRQDKLLASAGGDMRLEVMMVTDAICQRVSGQTEGLAMAATIGGNGQTIAIYTSEGSIEVWRVQVPRLALERVVETRLPCGHDADYVYMAHHSEELVCKCKDGHVFLIPSSWSGIARYMAQGPR